MERFQESIVNILFLIFVYPFLWLVIIARIIKPMLPEALHPIVMWFWAGSWNALRFAMQIGGGLLILVAIPLMFLDFWLGVGAIIVGPAAIFIARKFIKKTSLAWGDWNKEEEEAEKKE